MCASCAFGFEVFLGRVFLGTPAADEEVRIAEEKFDESKQVTETALHNLLENDVSPSELMSLPQSKSFVSPYTHWSISFFHSFTCVAPLLRALLA